MDNWADPKTASTLARIFCGRKPSLMEPPHVGLLLAPRRHFRQTRYRSSRCREPFAAEASLRLASRISSARGCSGRSSQATRGRLTSDPLIVFLTMSTTRSSRLERRRAAAARAILRFETSVDSVIKHPFGDRDGAHHSRRMMGDASASAVRRALPSPSRRAARARANAAEAEPTMRNSGKFWPPEKGEAPAIRSLSSAPMRSRAPVPRAKGKFWRNPDYEADLPISRSGMETSSESSRDNRCPFANLRPNAWMKFS